MAKISAAKLHRLAFVIAFLFASLIARGALAQNVLVDGDFESTPSTPPLANGNNIGHSIAPWVLGPGNQANVVQVDGGSPYNYGSNGPQSDASAPGAGIPQHYLDIADGSNDFYQSFTAKCTGEVTFGGAFSTRANSPGSATVRLLNGVGTGGTVVGTTQTINLPAGNSQLDPWTMVSYTASITAGQTYSFDVSMDNNMNFDNGFVTYNQNCGGGGGLVKICKVAGPGVPIGTPFNFAAAVASPPSSKSLTVPAGPQPGGYCEVGPNYPVNTNVMVTETGPPGYAVSSIVVAPSGGTTNLANGTVSFAVGAGVTEVTYTDYKNTGYLEICKQASPPGAVGVTGNFTFTVNPGNIGPITVPAGACSPAIEVPAGPVVITETSGAGTLVACSTIPAGPCTLGPQSATVTVAPGDISTQTIAVLTNRPPRIGPLPDKR
jgi:hypothetical protein